MYRFMENEVAVVEPTGNGKAPQTKTLITMRELYRGYDQIADAVVRVATRIWYAVLKLG